MGDDEFLRGASEKGKGMNDLLSVFAVVGQGVKLQLRACGAVWGNL